MVSLHDTAAHGRLRPASLVMSPARAAAAFPSRMSFGRTTVARLLKSDCSFERVRVDLDPDGVGSCLYRLMVGGHRFHFLVVSENFDPAAKTDHSAGRNWDASAVLCEGEWTEARERMLLRETPKQRHGRFDYDTLCTLRGNRSGRLFSHVVESLAEGRQPSAALISKVGYALRTTGLIANGALGMRPFAGLGADHPFARPYEVQMVASLLLREYTFDLIEDMARHRNRDAVLLSPALKRFIGVGNAAGAGLVPFIVNNPAIVDRWCRRFEEALAFARSRLAADPGLFLSSLLPVLDKAIAYFGADERSGNGIFCSSALMVRELVDLRDLIVETGPVTGLLEEVDKVLAVSNCETAEVFNTIVIEILDENEIERFLGDLTCAAEPRVDPAQPVALLRQRIEAGYAWALEIDFSDPDATRYCWYRSLAAPLDPRRTVRVTAAWPEVEARMDVACKVRQLHDLTYCYEEALTADLIADHPQLRDITARVQGCADLDYAEFRDNPIGRAYRPFAAMRLSLAFYGMEKLEPSLPKSVKGAFLQGAPTMADIAGRRNAGDWPFPLAPADDDTLSAYSVAPLVRKAAFEADAAGSMPGAALPTSGERVLCAPRELHRLLSKALLATGYSLGQSERLAGTILFSQALHGNAIEACIADMLRGRYVHEGGLRLLGNGGGYGLSGHSLLGAALDAADLAAARASQQSSPYSLVLQGAAGASMLDFLALQQARSGYLSVHGWMNDTSGGGAGRHGLTVAGPDGWGGVWLLVCTPDSADYAARLFELAGSVIPGLAVAFSDPEAVGLQITASISRQPGLPCALVAAVEAVAPSRLLNAGLLAELQFARERHGERIRGATFQALEQIGLGILVDDGDIENED